MVSATPSEATPVYELPAALSAVAEPLYAGAWADRAYLQAVFEGRFPARIFVDDPERPRAALMCRTYEFFLGGEPAPALRRFIAEAPEEAEVFASFYGYVAFNPDWIAALHADHPGRLEEIGRRSFTFDPARRSLVAGWRERVPEAIAIQPLDLQLARRADVELDEVIGLLWDGYDRYGEQGFGFCAMSGERMASVTFTLARSSQEANLGVATAPAFRRRGLATLCSQATIERALELGLTPTWDCDTANVASARLAHHLGFTEGPSFVEIAFPRRATPTQTHRQWRRSPQPDGGAVWERRG
jgi:GNAT superfamily N-acetyltransferase